MINNPQISDCSIKTQDEELFHLHKGLLITSFKDMASVEKFLKKVDGELCKQDLEDLVFKLYQGYGEINEKLRAKYDITAFDSQEDFEEGLR